MGFYAFVVTLMVIMLGFDNFRLYRKLERYNSRVNGMITRIEQEYHDATYKF